MEVHMEYLITLVLCFLVLCLLDYLVRPKIKVPTPNRLPIIGNILSVGWRPHITFKSWIDQYGDMFMLQAFKEQFLVLNNYDVIHNVLYDQRKVTAGRYCFYRAFVVLGGDKHDLAMQDMSPKVKKLKKFAHNKLKSYGSGLSRIESISLTISTDLVNSLLKQPCDRSGIAILDPYDILYKSVVSTFSCIACGKNYGRDDDIVRRWIIIETIAMKYTTFVTGIELDMFPWLRHFGNSTFKRMETLKKELNVVYARILNDFEHRDEQEDKLGGLAFALLDELNRQGGDDSGFLTDDIVKNTLLDLLVAGGTTTTAAMYAFMMILAKYPHIQERIVDEIRTVLDVKGIDEDIVLDDKESMPYTIACLLELQRYGVFVPLAALHKAMDDIYIHNIFVPKGTIMIPNIWSALRDETFWKDPYEFIPERFLDESGCVLKHDHINRKRMIAFGLGPRICLGQTMVQAELFVYFAKILRSVKISCVAGEEPSYDSREYVFAPACAPKRCRLAFSRRSLCKNSP